MVLSDHHLHCHLFAGRSYFGVSLEDEIEEFQILKKNEVVVIIDTVQHSKII